MTDKPQSSAPEVCTADDLSTLDAPTAPSLLEQADAKMQSLAEQDAGRPTDADMMSIAQDVQAQLASAFVDVNNLPQEAKWRIQTLVRGGTTTSAYDREISDRVVDADNRRTVDDVERAVGRTPIEQGGGLVFEHKFTDQQTSPRVLLSYVGRGREVRSQMLCELVNDEISGEHTLIFVCPECFGRGVPSQFCQCHVRSSHRAWHVDTKRSGEVKAVRNSDNAAGIEYYVSAGEIMDTDVLRCSNANCGAAFKIHRNIMYRVG